MRFYSNLLFQIDESCRYIRDGRPEHLRLALLLLDNAAEMQMAEYIEDAFERERWNERLEEFWQEIRDAREQKQAANDALHFEELPDAAYEALLFKPLSRRQKHNIKRNFEDKVLYIIDRKRELPEYLRWPLVHLHKYRNEAYHHNSVRTDTIQTACLVLFEIVCEMALTFTHSLSYSSGENYSWIQERLGVDSSSLIVSKVFLT